MRMLSLIACLMLFSVASNAKCTQRNDYIVLNNNDTLYGRVYTFVGFKNRRWVRLKNEQGKKRYAFSEVKALNIRCLDYWRLKYLHVSRPEEGYLQVLVSGKMSLLYSYCRAARLDFDLYVLLENGEVVFVSNNNYQQTLLPILQQSETFRNQTDSTGAPFPKYNRHFMRRITNYVNWYNEG